MNLVEVKNNQIVVTSSLKVAETFGKQHKDVLKSIVNLVAQNFATKNYFFESTHENRGKQYKMYYMNRDGFSLLVMGFTGKKAIEWKIKFINAFNEMEEALKHPKSTVPVPQFRRVTWRGEVVMISTHLASIMGLCPSTIKRTAVLNDVYSIIVLHHLPVNTRTDERQYHIMQTIEEMWIETGSQITGLHKRIETL